MKLPSWKLKISYFELFEGNNFNYRCSILKIAHNIYTLIVAIFSA